MDDTEKGYSHATRTDSGQQPEKADNLVVDEVFGQLTADGPNYRSVSQVLLLYNVC